MTIGQRIKAYRESKGWSLSELAKRTGYSSRSTIYYIETGKTELNSSAVMKFAEVFGVTPTELLGWGKPLPESELELIEQVCQDEELHKRLINFARKLKEIKDAETAQTT